MDWILRRLAPADLEAADRLIRLAYQTPESRLPALRRYLALQPDGWWLSLRADTPVGMGGAVDYGPFAYLGLMAVHPDCQRLGIGQGLLERLLGWLDGRGVPAVLLDATPAGAPLYQRYGFVAEDEACLFEGPAPGAAQAGGGVGRAGAADLEAIRDFDVPIFGADRLRLLRALLGEFPDRFLLVRDDRGAVAGYLVAQPRRLGPWVAQGPAEAEALLAAALTLPLDGPPIVIAPGGNPEAAALLPRHGFRLVRATRHMRRGSLSAPRGRSRIFGQESFAVG